MKYQDRKHLINEKIRESENQKIMNELREKIEKFKNQNPIWKYGFVDDDEVLDFAVEVVKLIQSQPINKELRCVTGCICYSGGEAKHHEDCEHYPESLSKSYNDQIKELEGKLELKDVTLNEIGKIHKEKLDQITQLQKKVEWISVKDRLPEDQEPVLLCGDMKPYFDNWYEIGYYFEPDKEFYKVSSNGEEKLSNVTHWKCIVELNN